MSNRSQTRVSFVTDSKACSLEFATRMNSLGFHQCSAIGWADASILSVKKELTFCLQTTLVIVCHHHLL